MSVSRLLRGGASAALLSLASLGCAQAAAIPPARVEARSQDLITVGVVQNDRMSIHISRLLDNAPVRDAVVAVLLRGGLHPTVAEADGSYTLVDPQLQLSGAAAVEFQITRGAAHESLKGRLDIAAPAAGGDEKSQARQYWWWALNFGVCIGFLVLLSRRKKKAE